VANRWADLAVRATLRREVFQYQGLDMRYWMGLCLALSAVAGADDRLDKYIDLRTGTFSSAAQAAADSRYDSAVWHVVEVPFDDQPARWLYLEAWIDQASAPYLQRLVRHHLEADGSIVAVSYRLPDPEARVGAWQAPGRLAEIDRSRLHEVTGCELIIVRTGPRRFEGRTRGAQCANTYRQASYAVSQSLVTDEGLVNWDRGFSADGQQVWGPKSGGYRLRRVDEGGAACDQPVRLLVFGTIADRQAFGAYAGALQASGLYRKNGGYWVALTPALEVFEGDPPPGRGAVIAHFPCLEAARRFWNDAQYQNEIAPLRRGVSEFEVLVLPVLPRPEWVTD